MLNPHREDLTTKFCIIHHFPRRREAPHTVEYPDSQRLSKLAANIITTSEEPLIDNPRALQATLSATLENRHKSSCIVSLPFLCGLCLPEPRKNQVFLEIEKFIQQATNVTLNERELRDLQNLLDDKLRAFSY